MVPFLTLFVKKSEGLGLTQGFLENCRFKVDINKGIGYIGYKSRKELAK
jgi:hypothetical protein